MKRFLMIFFCLSLILAWGIPATAAVPVADLTTLAQYFPQKTVFFASMRTDAAYIDTLDGLLERISSAVPEANLQDSSIRSMLDDFVRVEFEEDASFAEVFGSWMGDSFAFGVPSTTELFDSERDNDSDAPVLIAFEITDREASVGFFTANLGEPSEINIEETETYTLITPSDYAENSNAALYISEDVLLLTNELPLTQQRGGAGSLAASEDFTNSLGYLPATDYNALAYINLPEILSNIPTDELEPEEAAVLSAIAPVFDAVGGQVIGATILDDRSLILDYVQPITDLAAYEAFGITINTDYTPVDYDFARFIPAGTPFVLQGTDLQAAFNSAITNLAAAAAMQESFVPDGVESPVDQIDDAMNQIQFAISGLTGLSLQEEILSWMTGNYALAMRLSPALSDLASASDVPSEFPVDFSFLVEATDPEAAQAVVDGLAQALTVFGEDGGFEVTIEEIGGTSAQVVTIPESSDTPFPVVFVFGASDEVFVFGTPRMAEAALDPADGLTGDPGYIEMQTYALENPISLYYFAGEGLTPITRLLALTAAINAQDEDAVDKVFRLVSSSSITWTMEADGTTIYRMVLTLPE